MDKEYTREELGQYFTKKREVDFMVSLIENGSKILEPSCGPGVFLNSLSDFPCVDGIEFDQKVAHKKAKVLDFFDFSETNKYDTIIGNPPYVSNANIVEETKEKLLGYESWSGKTNLFVLFIEKCLNHLEENGELIFIVPSVFMQATSCLSLNKRMHSEGSYTHLVRYKDVTPFGLDAHPEHETCIFRYKKGEASKITKIYSLDQETKQIKLSEEKKHYVDPLGITYFLDKKLDVQTLVPIKNFFSIKVGAVSGLDSFFADEERGNKFFVCSYTRKTGNLKKMICEDSPTEWLKDNEKLLRSRKIKKEWTDNDWWKWGRPQPKAEGKRIYVNGKTRQSNPFFYNDCENYDGSILGVFLKDQNMKVEKVVEVFNNVDWEMFSMKIGGRYIFKQKQLENCFLTEEQIKKCY